jgi:dolichol-phosphate mannosyltransferase
MFRFAASAIISFSAMPIKLGIWIGIITSAFAFLELTYIIIKYFQGVTVPGWASTVGIISVLFGIQFILLGCIGIYIASIHECLKNRPKFIVNEKFNF